LGVPVLAGGMVYATSLDRSVYAVDARSGTVRWRFRPGPVLGGATVVNGVVCVGDDHGFYGLNAANGALRWRYRHGERPAGTAVAAGRLCYLPTDRGVAAVEAHAGRVRWRVALAHGAGDLAVAAGTVYGSVRHGPDTLYALDAATGARRWAHPLGAATGRPLATGGGVYAGGSDGVLYALDGASGTPRWRFQAPGGLTGAPARAGRHVVVASGGAEGGHVCAVDTATGLAAWSYPVHGGLASGPAAHGGDVYVNAGDGYLYALTGGVPGT
jgi:serine/threonine-protein kinase